MMAAAEEVGVKPRSRAGGLPLRGSGGLSRSRGKSLGQASLPCAGSAGPATRGPGRFYRRIRPCTCLRSGRQACSLPASSDPVSLRHPKQTVYGCFLPDLTRFAALRRAGPDRQHRLTRAVPNEPALRQGFNPARADCGFRAPLAPRLARPELMYGCPHDRVKAQRQDC